MTLASGTRLGAYEVLSLIGVGGMGEVYRARDTRLSRDVALKVLPDVFAHDADRLARFQREAQVLASLNHPHIAGIYGIEEADGIRALVLELVPGETLESRLARYRSDRRSARAPGNAARGSGLPLEEALTIARQIAEALEAAHDRGIVHRDLKPANIKLTPDGTVKVLDFGLAKALSDDAASADPSTSPTRTGAATRAGIILGTAAYMSPEQARGHVVDKRADIWAFGCVLYEMLTGEGAFAGDEVTDVLARIIEREPDFNALPASTPRGIRRLLRRSLEKDRKRRLPDIADARIEIDEALGDAFPDEGAAEAPAPARRRWLLSLTLALGAGAAGVLAGYFILGVVPVAPRTVRLVIAPPPTDPLYGESIGTAVTIDRDGRQIVYPGIGASTLQLYARRLDRVDASPIRGSAGARQPFFAPDGEWVGFWAPAEGEIRKVPVGGGPAVAICKAPSGNFYGASWGPDGSIVFASGGLYRVSASGGVPRELTTPTGEEGDAEHRWPEILPDGKHVMFTRWAGGGFDRARIVVRSLTTGAETVVVEGAAAARYAHSGHLIYAQGGTMMAAPFEVERLEVTGPAVSVQESVRINATGVADMALARDGTLVFVPGSGTPERKLVWVDRDGRASPLIDAPGDYWLPRLSPDGTRLGVGIGSDLWVIDLKRLTRTRVTLGVTATLFPFTWSGDGERIVFSKAEQKVGLDIYSVAADGSGQPELVVKGEYRQWPTSSTSARGQVLALYEQHPTTLRDIWMFSRDSGRSRFLVAPFQERSPEFSPDGRWVTYCSNESGRDEVYVRPAAGAGGRVTVSTRSGTEPVWSPTGREIFYRSGGLMMAAAVEARPALTIGPPRVLFEGAYERDRGSAASNPNYDVAPDGQRFVMIQAPTTSSNIVVVLNWLEDLRRLAPRK